MASLVLLFLAGLVGLPQYFRRLRGSTSRWLHLTASSQLALLAAAALVAAVGDQAPIPWAAAATFSVAAAAIGGGPVTMSILRLSDRSSAAELGAVGCADGDHHRELSGIAEASRARGDDPSVGDEPAVQGVADAPRGAAALQGGAWIGLLERTAIAATLWCGWPEGLAIVLAVKGLGRYAELGKDGAAERFILGTFSSVLWACACTGAAVLATV